MWLLIQINFCPDGVNYTHLLASGRRKICITLNITLILVVASLVLQLGHSVVHQHELRNIASSLRVLMHQRYIYTHLVDLNEGVMLALKKFLGEHR